MLHPLYQAIGNNTLPWIDTATKQYVLPCSWMANTTQVMSLQFGNLEIPIQFGDLMYVCRGIRKLMWQW